MFPPGTNPPAAFVKLIVEPKFTVAVAVIAPPEKSPDPDCPAPLAPGVNGNAPQAVIAVPAAPVLAHQSRRPIQR